MVESSVHEIGNLKLFFFNSYARECLLPKINKSRPINLREHADEKWITTSSEEFPAHKYGMYNNCIPCFFYAI